MAENSISLLDFSVQIEKDGTVNHDFYQKKAKAKLLPHFKTALPSNVKKSILRNEIVRREERCSSPNKAAAHIQDFHNTMRMNGYPDDFLHTHRPQTRNLAQIRNDKFMYFEFPFLSDKIDFQVRKVFKDLQIPVRLYRKSHTLRNALQGKPSTGQCRLRKCTLQSDLCLIHHCVYRLTCDKCEEFYVGSTIRHFHLRHREHMTQHTSSVYQHRVICRATYTSSILARDHDAVKLRFKEAMIIQSSGATISNRMERQELQHLLF